MTARVSILRAVGATYKLAFPLGEQCAYCGQNADTQDHVPAISVLAGLIAIGEGDKHERRIVPACSDCNKRLSNHPSCNLAARRRHIIKKLERKHQKLLRRVVWDEDDLEDVGYSMRNFIETSSAKREWILTRLKVLKDNS